MYIVFTSNRSPQSIMPTFSNPYSLGRYTRSLFAFIITPENPREASHLPYTISHGPFFHATYILRIAGLANLVVSNASRSALLHLCAIGTSPQHFTKAESRGAWFVRYIYIEGHSHSTNSAVIPNVSLLTHIPTRDFMRIQMCVCDGRWGGCMFVRVCTRV